MLAYSTLHLPFSHAMEHKPACTTQIFRASPDATSSMMWTPFWNIESRYLLIFLRKSNSPLTIRGNSQWWTTFRGTGANIVLYFLGIPDHHWQLGKILSRGTFVGGHLQMIRSCARLYVSSSGPSEDLGRWFLSQRSFPCMLLAMPCHASKAAPGPATHIGNDSKMHS